MSIIFGTGVDTSTLTKDGDPRTPQLNISIGGQNGIMQDPANWVQSAGYSQQKMRAVLFAAPGAMPYMENPELQLAALKSLIELMPESIDGLNSGINWDFDGPMVGHAGEKFEEVTSAKRDVSAPNFTWSEKYGMAVTRYWTEFGRQLLMDPDLQHPAIISSPTYIAAGSPPLLPNMRSFTVLFFEPDVTFTNITKAWLCTNMQPRKGGEITGKLELGGTNEIPKVNIEFTAFTLVGKAVNILALNYIRSLKLTDMRPLELEPFYNGISPDVEKVTIGLAQEITDAVLPANN